MKVNGILEIRNCIWTLPNITDITDKTHILLAGGKLICDNVSINSYSVSGLKFLENILADQNKVLSFVRLTFKHINDSSVGHFSLSVGKSEINDSV
jgi:hypothetical protein